MNNPTPESVSPAVEAQPYQKLYEAKARQLANLVSNGHETSILRIAAWLRAEDRLRAPIPEAAPQEDKSEGIAEGVFAIVDPSPFPIGEKFTLYLDDEGDFIIQSQKESGLLVDATTPEDAVYRMRQLLDLAAQVRPVVPEAAEGGELTYDDCSKADADAAEQYAVAYVSKVGVSKENMIDAISTLRAQLLTYMRAALPVPSQAINQEMRKVLLAMVADDAFAELCQGIGEEPNWLKQARAVLAPPTTKEGGR